MGEESSLRDKRYLISAAAGDPAMQRCVFSRSVSHQETLNTEIHIWSV